MRSAGGLGQIWSLLHGVPTVPSTAPFGWNGAWHELLCDLRCLRIDDSMTEVQFGTEFGQRLELCSGFGTVFWNSSLHRFVLASPEGVWPGASSSTFERLEQSNTGRSFQYPVSHESLAMMIDVPSILTHLSALNRHQILATLRDHESLVTLRHRQISVTRQSHPPFISMNHHQI